jgi:hypothetical protein
MTSKIPAIAVAAAVLAAASIAWAQDTGVKPPAGQAGAAPAPAGGAAPSAAEQAMMEKYMKAATPGPEHADLGKLAGKWKLAVTAWMAPGAPPQKSDGSAEFKPILGGRYMQQEVHGDMGGQPFEGLGIEGYDNVTKQRVGTWVDSMSTGPMVTRGKCAAGAKKCTFRGKMPDAVAGKEVPVSETLTMIDDNSFKFEMNGPGPDGKVFKMMEIVYTRQ